MMNPLEIIVCVKPVPDPKRWDKLKLDPETMLLRRADVPAVLNPLDRTAIAAALALRQEAGGVVTALTMAPPEAEEQLLETLALGCDRACHLVDPLFAGADTLATARALAAAARKLGRYDLLLCGAYSLDGSTAQVGPQLAELLGLPDMTHATKIEITKSLVRAHCHFDGGVAICEADLPVVITVAQGAAVPQLPSMSGLRRASTERILRWSAADLGCDPAEVGLAGSPTRMLNTFMAPHTRKGEILHGSPDELARALMERLRTERVAG